MDVVMDEAKCERMVVRRISSGLATSALALT
jgi:hypothetical protein